MPQKKISSLTAFSLMLFAISIDTLQLLVSAIYLIPVFGWTIGFVLGAFLTFVGTIILSAWFYYLGVKFVSRIIAATVFEMVPIMSSFTPGFTLATGLTILIANNQKLGSVLGYVGLSAGMSAVGGGGVRNVSHITPPPPSQRAGFGETRAAQQEEAQRRERMAQRPQYASSPEEGARVQTKKTPNDGLIRQQQKRERVTA